MKEVIVDFLNDPVAFVEFLLAFRYEAAYLTDPPKLIIGGATHGARNC